MLARKREKKSTYIRSSTTPGEVTKNFHEKQYTENTRAHGEKYTWLRNVDTAHHSKHKRRKTPKLTEPRFANTEQIRADFQSQGDAGTAGGQGGLCDRNQLAVVALTLCVRRATHVSLRSRGIRNKAQHKAAKTIVPLLRSSSSSLLVKKHTSTSKTPRTLVKSTSTLSCYRTTERISARNGRQSESVNITNHEPDKTHEVQ